MNEIKIFENEKFGNVRVAMSEKNEPLFCLSDVCKILNLRQGDVRQRLDDGVVSTQPLETSGGIQNANFVTEDGLYDVILDSRKAEAKQFRKWVTSDVLPTIRKTGGYVNDTSKFVESYFGNCDENAKAFLVQSLDNNKRLLEQNEQQSKLIEEQKPKAEFYDAVTGSTDTIDMRMVATTLNCGLGRNRIFELLRSKGILDRKNKPFQRYVDAGYFRTIESSYCKPDGSECINIKTVVFQKGLDFIRNILNNK